MINSTTFLKILIASQASAFTMLTDNCLLHLPVNSYCISLERFLSSGVSILGRVYKGVYLCLWDITPTFSIILLILQSTTRLLSSYSGLYKSLWCYGCPLPTTLCFIGPQKCRGHTWITWITEETKMDFIQSIFFYQKMPVFAPRKFSIDWPWWWKYIVRRKY